MRQASHLTRRSGPALLALLLALTAASWSFAARAQDKDLVVFAAASLKNALDNVNALYLREKGRKVVVSYGASPALARQIENAAPADLFISADLDWMDYLAQRNLIKANTRTNLLGNRLVLAAPADSKVVLTIAPNFPLAQALGNGRLAIADPNSVPAGKYGKAALEALGVWQSVSNKIVPGPDVRATLVFVSRGEAPLGIVYQTDAAADKGVKIIGMFPENTHPPIIYPIAITAGSNHPNAAAYLSYLGTASAKPLFEKEGFTVLK